MHRTCLLLAHQPRLIKIMVKTIEKLSSEQWVRAWEAVVDSSHQVLHWQEQVGRVFPELRATVQYLYENRRQWNEMCLADIDADTFKTPAEKGAERVGRVHHAARTDCSFIILHVPMQGLCLPSQSCQIERPQDCTMLLLLQRVASVCGTGECSGKVLVIAGEGHGKAESLPRQVRGLLQHLLWQPARELQRRLPDNSCSQPLAHQRILQVRPSIESLSIGQ